MNYTKDTLLNGLKCIEMSAGGYNAFIAYELGSNVIRLRDAAHAIDVFRFNEKNSAQDLKQSAEVWGLPILYLPNRFADGILKTSDSVYNLPVNEKAPYNNHIHGFMHKRMHKVAEHFADENRAVVKTVFDYDENDEFFAYLPIKFKAELTFELSQNGLEFKIVFTNFSDKFMPISFATHTTIKTPFADGGKEQDVRIRFCAGGKCELDDRCLPTERILDLTAWDEEYKTGEKCPVLQDISNDMYQAQPMMLDTEEFYGAIIEDSVIGKGIKYEVSPNHKFWIIWNDKGVNGYFCPEPMSAMINAPNLSAGKDKSGYFELSPNGQCEFSQHFSTWSNL